ncbi:MAG: cell division protein FtsZ, partial [Betaproteobacteria bacterium]|nr:cell division protein FtsZ [Betaproteobacteria bacterium]
VPQVSSTSAPLPRLRESAQELSDKLDAAVTDENGAPLSDLTWAQLEAQLHALYAALAERELPAGGAAARRLYS